VVTEQTGVTPLDATEFAWKRDVGAPTTGEHGVVPGIDLTAMLHDAANDLVTELFGVADLKSLSTLAIQPVLRGISAVFEAPLEPGTPVFVGATLGSLSRRSFELKTGVWMAKNRELIAHGSAAFVVVDAESRRTAAVPERVAEALRSLRPALGTVSQPLGNRHSDAVSPRT
jgi:acyl-CoA thioesterase FadM